MGQDVPGGRRSVPRREQLAGNIDEDERTGEHDEQVQQSCQSCGLPDFMHRLASLIRCWQFDDR